MNDIAWDKNKSVSPIFPHYLQDNNLTAKSDTARKEHNKLYNRA